MFLLQITILALCFIFGEQLENCNISNCTKDWLEMTDQNYAETVDRYKQCLDLSKLLKGEDRRKYKSKMGENLVTSCKQFLEKTLLPPKDLVRTIRSIVRMLEPYLEDESSFSEDEDMSSSLTPKNSSVQLSENGDIVSRALNKTPTVKQINKLTTMQPTLITDSSECTTTQITCGSAAPPIQTTCAPPPLNDNRKLYEMLIFLGYLLLIIVQVVILLCLGHLCILFCRSEKRECPAKNICPKNFPVSDLRDEKLDKNPSQVIQPVQVHHHTEHIKSQSDATPSTSAEMAASKQKTKLPTKISAELSSLSSSDLGSDSEFEALMRRRPLLEKRKRSTQ